jgi:hypothetical protein
LAGAFLTAAFLAGAFFAGFLFVVIALTLVHPWPLLAEVWSSFRCGLISIRRTY